MKLQLRQIYDDLSNGRLSQKDALAMIKALKLQEQIRSTLLAPVWRAAELDGSASDYAEHHVVLCERAAAEVEALLPGSQCVSLQSGDASIARRYTGLAVASFERIQAILQRKPQGNVLVQIVVADERLAGLSGLLMTAALENPRITGQLVIVPESTSAEELARRLADEKSRGREAKVRYEQGVRQVVRWEDVPADGEQPPVAFRDGGVYLITGGLGALGLLFAREIAAKSRDAKVILTGRSPLTQPLPEGLSATYRQVDLGDADQVRQLVASIVSKYGKLDGILHSAGMIADDFLLKKSAAEFRDVLVPKVAGTFHLDQATQDVALDFFVLFSSFAGAMGNVGQGDYATANAFMDHFAAARNRQVAAGQRQGRTRSINWPLWQDGGMDVDAASRELLEKTTGSKPMQTATGMDAFQRSLVLPHAQTLVVEGDLARIREALQPSTTVIAARPATQDGVSSADVFEKTQDYLRGELSAVLKMDAQDLDPQAALEKYGIDSILAVKLTNQLEQTFGTLSKTLFFEYQTIRELAEYFVQSHAARLATLFAAPQQTVAVQPQAPAVTESKPLSNRRSRRRRTVDPSPAAEADPIAIVGLSGRYPEAVDVEAYWQNLRDGKDCITEVPKERWDWREYFSEDRTEGGRHYSKWGGFITGVDEFDPLFFNISPKEAKHMDPQERLFLQHAWMAIEDAGYTRASLQIPAAGDLPGQVGVYVGVMYSEYQLFGAEASLRGNRLGIAGSAASIANRVSYAFNLHGPSVTLDTMCSSSLTAIHFACQDLKQGRTSLAIAGGVNVTIHPNKYLVLSAGQFISSDGACQSFGEGGDGYIPGEGVGVVVLKRLSEAKRDGDHIYGVIRGTALNHGGKTNGYTVPNPQAQATAISRAMTESKTDARHVSYIEAHGTGTKLGDPIEIAALGKAFMPYTQDTGFCLIGSAKSNIGHCESAAGIAGLTKVLLQMQHRQIVPSLHSAQLNPHIDFDRTPFVVNQSLRTWEQPVVDGRILPRIAGISSFGAGGSNAHVIVEEYVQPLRQSTAAAPFAIVLSARTTAQLQQKAQDLLSFLRPRRNDVDLASIAWTLQAGREAMDERLGFVVSSVDQLLEKLQAFAAGEEGAAYQGQVGKRNQSSAAPQTLDATTLVEAWVKGAEIDWSKCYGETTPQRITLPTYPFAKERYWIDVTPVAKATATAVLHPLLHSNTSDLTQQSYSSTFRGDEPFLKNGRLPAAAYLEMARVAVQKASSRDGVLELRDVVWAQPVAVDAPAQVSIALFTNEANELEFEIYSEDTVHCQGRALWNAQPVTARRDGEMLRVTAEASTDYAVDPNMLDAALAAFGFPSAIESVQIVAPCSGEMVAWLCGNEADLCDAQGNVCVQLRGVSGERLAEVEEEAVVVAPPAPRPAPVRREIILAPGTAAVSLGGERRKPAVISLSAPAAPAVQQPSAARARVALSNATVPSVRLYDDGDGIFSILGGNSAAEVRRALDRVQQEPSLEVLLIHGLALSAYDRELARVLASFPYPVIGVLPGDTTGAAFQFAALCDFMVCSEEARYGFGSNATPLFRQRFGAARDLTIATGRELRAQGWTFSIVPAAQVESTARELAATFTAKSQDALRLLKAHLTRTLADTGAADTRSGEVRVVKPQDLGQTTDAKALVLVLENEELSDDAVQALLTSEVPVIAAVTGNAPLASLFCDGAVYGTNAVFYAHRAGNVLVAEDVVATATRVAASWGPRTTRQPENVERASARPEGEPTPALRSRVVTVTPQPDGVVVVKMEDRDAKNMFSEALREGMAEAFAHIAATPSYKVVVLTGYDSYFASGGTKESLLAIQAGTIKFTDSTMFRLPLECELPVVAAMQGHGIGAGWSLGMFADLALLSEESRYVSPYMDYGFTPGAGATLSLPDKMGEDLARESLLTAQPTTGRALKERGLLLPVLPRNEVLRTAMAVAAQLAQFPRHRLIALKQQWSASVRSAIEETLRREVAMHEQTFVGRSDTLAQIESNFHQEAATAAPVAPPPVQTAPAADSGDLLFSVAATLRTLLASELQMRESDVDDHAQFIDLGLDSISGVTWIRKINEKYQTTIEATKVYSFPTLAELSRHVLAEAEKAGTLSAPAAPAPVIETPVETPVVTAVVPVKSAPRAVATTSRTLTSRRGTASRFVAAAPAAATVVAPAPRQSEPIAIIGMAGQFPEANTVAEYWRNLAEGRNCISQVSRERWDVDAFYQPGEAVPGKTYSHWLGALSEYDRFDPLFFNISPNEAISMDPQQRLFLQACWHTIEDAGYDARVLSGSKCGVYVGAATGDYHQLSQVHRLTAHGFTGNATSVLAARISYFLNLKGPCVSVDTACSSSLVAIAQACDSLTSGATDLALAGGVYVMAGPEMHIRTAQAAMLSPEGRCFTFDQRADGFVPGEGVGVVMLKRLSDAQRDGDVIYGVVQGWGVNQDGKTNGITAPNPESQTRLEQEIYDKFDIDPAGIQLVEAHGTATKLGDPIEIEGLKTAFARYTQNREYCALGSVKSNIGHTLTAAGIAGVIKLLLALKHRQLPPTINFEKLNEHIDLTNSPFYVNTRLQEWKLNGAPKRQAAISSFGFSGTNAHLVLGEYAAAAEVARPHIAKTLVPLSARTAEQLRQKAQDLLDFIRTETADVADVAYTLQVGRVAMDERLAFVVSSTEQLAEKLEAWLRDERADDVYQGHAKRNREALALFTGDADLQQTIDKWLVNQKLPRLGDLWVKGLELDWRKLYGEVRPPRIPLPLYPFAKERYWVDAIAVTPAVTTAATAAVLHPLLHTNASDLSGQRYRSTFTGEQTLSAAALLEMARAAVDHAMPERPETAVLELRNVVWGEPVVVNGSRDVTIALFADDGEQIDFEVSTGETVHCQGIAVFSEIPAPAALDQLGLRVPSATEYVLHPNVLDGLFEGGRTPVSLDSLRIFAPCPTETFASVRESALDLCDARGNVCVQLRGLSLAVQEQAIGRLLANPVWQASEGDAGRIEYAGIHVIPCLTVDENIARSYSEHALACFERIQSILESKPKGKVLVQIVVADERLAGLAGLLKTATLENPQFVGQLVIAPADAELEPLLESETQRATDTVVRYEYGVRQVLRWEEVVEAGDEPPVAFHDGGVYLITGGFGGLGVLFTNEILGRTRDARVILTGRSALSGEKQARLDEWAGRVTYRQADVADLAQVEALIDSIGPLNGILHCAGVIAENLIPNKSSGEFRDVLAPKVAGTFNLDQASRDVELDFFVLFSSLAGAMGNRRTADYAVANGFQDHFAAYRNAQVAAGQRHGRTRSINWPVWQDGGMGTDAASQERLEQATGMRPMQTATGLHAFYRSLALPLNQMLIVEGVPAAIRASYLQKPRVAAPAVTRRASVAARVSIDQLHQRLKQLLASVLQMETSGIDVDQAFMELGLDSFLGAALVTAVNKEYGTELSHLQVFDYPTIRELAAHLEQQLAKAPAESVEVIEAPAVMESLPATAPRVTLKKKARNGRRSMSHQAPPDNRIAIIGMSGRYAEAENLQRYWENLAQGRNSVGEVPPSRWDVQRYYDAGATRKNTANSKWLGAMADIDCFDPLFFRISPQEADFIDPHHRLFLQESYRAFEDAGYSSSTLGNRKCGVYLGISSNEYALLLAKHNALGNSPVTSNHPAIAAARIAYYLNLKGPAISVDTACSSSLVAIHLACQGLLSGETDMALAGGVTLWLTPESYVSMTQAGMLAADGQCKAFDDAADGIVVGDGVGALVLKRLSDAEADGDFIYGVILGSGVNQDGKTNGITAPSISSQIELERSVYARHNIDPNTISYVETHGTGTKLGDPIELEALSTVFKEKTDRKNYCGLGSVKSNIGHTTSAAGVAGVQKVLLSLRNRTLAPTLHVTRETSRFDFSNSPFYLVREKKAWDVAPGTRRRAAVSSFGFSGTNAHLVIEEYQAPAAPAVQTGDVIVPLSARTPEQLRQKSRDLLDFLRGDASLDLAAMAYTLQTGRDAMEERLGFVVRSAAELEEKLAAFVDGDKHIDGAFRGRVESSEEGITVIDRDDDMQEAIDKWIARGKHARLVELWVRGLSFDWNKLYDGPKPRRVSLPAYPFARERHWIAAMPSSETLDTQFISDVDMRSIEEIIDRIDDDGIDTEQAVTALKMLV